MLLGTQLDTRNKMILPSRSKSITTSRLKNFQRYKTDLNPLELELQRVKMHPHQLQLNPLIFRIVICSFYILYCNHITSLTHFIITVILAKANMKFTTKDTITINNYDHSSNNILDGRTPAAESNVMWKFY